MTTNLTGFTIAATYPQLLHIDGGPDAAEKTVYSGTGTPTVLKLSTVTASIENIQFNGNTITTLDVNGNLVLSPNGTGAVAIANILVTGGQITGITDLAIAEGGTGASDAAGARTNLGLGSMALQNSGAVNITGGTISGITLGGSYTGITLVSSVTVTGVTAVNGGNLQLSGNSLISTNTDGNITLQPNGVGVVIIGTMNLSAQTFLGTQVNANINITPNGTGAVVVPTLLATTVDTNVAAAGVTLAGTTLAADGTDADISINITPKGTGSVVISKADINGGTVDAATVGAATPAAVTGTDVKATGALGYATGAGGTVTQITSKSTGVTLNKLSGTITTHNENMGSNSVKNFVVTNSLVEAGDVPVVCMKSGGTLGEYLVGVDAVAAGSFNVQIYNQGTGALAEALVLNFVVIKGVAA